MHSNIQITATLRPLLVLACGLLLGLSSLPAGAAKGPNMPALESMPDEQLCILMAMLGPNLPPFCEDEEEEPVPPIQVFPVSAERSVFIDDVQMTIDLTVGERETITLEMDDPSRVTVAEFVIQPGAAFPWHTHPGPVFASVDAGEGGLVFIYADDCVRREYETGNIFVDPGGDNVHTAYNPSDTEETVIVATFFDVPDPDEDGTPVPLAIPVDAEEGEMLDEHCDFER